MDTAEKVYVRKQRAGAVAGLIAGIAILLLMGLGLVLFVAVAQAATGRWFVERDPKLGFTFSYPSSLFSRSYEHIVDEYQDLNKAE